MSESFASEVQGTRAEFERFVARRATSGRAASVRELYRLQTRSGGRALPGGRGVLMQFEADGGAFGRSLEQLGLAHEKGRWRVWTFQSNSLKKRA